MDLTKSQKKKVRELIDIGLIRDYTEEILDDELRSYILSWLELLNK